jgi:hypothetical protein
VASLTGCCNLISIFSACLNPPMPVVAKVCHLSGIEFASEAASKLCLVVAVEAQDGEIIGIIVAGIFVYVVNLDWLSGLMTHTTRSV